MDCIFGTIVKGAVALVVSDLSAGVSQNRLSGLHNLPFLALFRHVVRNSVNLAGVEDGIDPMDRAGAFLPARIPRRRIVLLVGGCFRRRVELPELDLGPLLAFPNLPAVFLGLLI